MYYTMVGPESSLFFQGYKQNAAVESPQGKSLAPRWTVFIWSHFSGISMWHWHSTAKLLFLLTTYILKNLP